MAVRLRVDPIMCDGFGHCAELAPELVVLDEWGYPILSEKHLSPRERKLAQDAVLQCPRKALFLEDVDERRSRSPRRR
jgi:ferredoxin